MTAGKNILVLVAAVCLAALALNAQSAPGGPGSIPTWTSGAKEAVGTATATESKVWFTLQGGIMTRFITLGLIPQTFALSNSW